MRVEFHHTKNGLPSALAFSMNFRLASRNSSSTVSMRLIVNGPVGEVAAFLRDPIDVRRSIPMMPLLFMLTLNQPMSSPQMIRMFGFF
jgi:hypothetical protein